MIIFFYLYVVLFVAFMIFLFTWYRYIERKKQNQPKQWQIQEYVSGNHTWKKYDSKGLYYCNVCRQLMAGICSGQILQCIRCGFLIHRLCRYKKKPKCKYVICSKQTQFNPHQWVEGNLPINANCAKCGLICSSFYDLEGSTCIWCQRTVHTDCQNKINETCDFGEFRKLIISPNEVRYSGFVSTQSQINNSIEKVKTSIISKFKGSKSQNNQIKQFNTTSDTDTDLDILKKGQTPQEEYTNRWKLVISQEKRPVIVVINTKSGGQVGQEFLKSFNRYLNPVQVIDLINEGLDKLLIFKNIENLQIIVGGGDGTVSSVINYMKSGKIDEWNKKNPPIAVLPLGTGNDMSRSLGWGGTYQEIDARYILQLVNKKSKQILLDRWNLDIVTFAPKNVNKQAQVLNQENHIIFNYASIGLDAKFCLGFHQLRQKYPHLFKSQFGNKFIYGQLGASDLLKGKRVNINRIAQIICDGQIINIPDCENLIVLNIDSWAGGVPNLWPQVEVDQGDIIRQNSNIINSDGGGSGSGGNNNNIIENSPSKDINKKMIFKPQSSCDGKLEVIGITSVWHLGQVQVGLAEPLTICQGNTIQIKICDCKKQAIQIDGEPFEISTPCNLNFSLKDKVYMLTSNELARHKWESKIVSTLDQLERQNSISTEQKDLLLQKLLA